jgi:hypothetical protein
MAPDRLVAELRLAQVAALVLALMAGVSVGLAIGHGMRPDLSVEVAVGGILFLVAAVAPFQDPRLALTIVALGFAAHAVTNVMHRPGLLPDDLATSGILWGAPVSTSWSGPSATCRC